MLETRKLLEEFKKEYELFKTKYKFNYSYEELDRILFLSNLIQQQKYIPTNMFLFLVDVLIDRLHKNIDFYYYILNPNPSNSISLKESSFFDEKKKEEFEKSLKELFSFSRKIISEKFSMINRDYSNFNNLFEEGINLIKKHIKIIKEEYSYMSKKWLEEKKEEKNEYSF